MISKGTFVVFDLDDTLYRECDYRDSGFRSVAQFVERVYGIDFSDRMSQWVVQDDREIFEKICLELGLPESVKESLIWQYRLHFPEIALSQGVRKTLGEIQSHSSGFAILTDGRSSSQRLKLRALGLSDIPVYISEEWGEVKPATGRFMEIGKRFSAEKFVYVGDNPKKDFWAPKKLGWTTIGLRDSGSNIHRQNVEELADEYLPDVWIETIDELLNLLC